MKQKIYYLSLTSLAFFLFTCGSKKSESKYPSKPKSEIVKASAKKKDKKKDKRKSKSNGIAIEYKVIESARKSKSAPDFRYGNINGVKFDKLIKDKELPTVSGNRLNFKSTWAYDPLSKSDGSGAMIKIDSKFYKINYGIPRPDVNRYTKLDKVLNCGIQGTVNISSLKPGVHNLSICLLGSNKKYYLESSPVQFAIIK